MGESLDRISSSVEAFAGRLRKNARHRAKWARRRGITCYRLYDRDIPEVPLAVDCYEGKVRVAEYARPGAPDGGDHGPWLEALVGAIVQVLGVGSDSVFLERRERQRGASQYGRISSRGVVFEVCEGGLRFQVNLSDYLDTGLFLDHRETRALVRLDARGRRMLNLFGYTGSFSVYAAAGGAAGTTTVDLSARYLSWAAENLRRNGFEPPLHETVRGDVLEFLEAAASRRRAFDLVVVDPPTFSNSKRTVTSFDVLRDHAALLVAVRRVVSPGGIVYFSTNARRFRLDETPLVGAYRIVEITDRTVPDDFARRRPHRCWRLEAA